MRKTVDAARSLLAPLKRLGRNEQVILSALALVIGATSGAAAIGFRYTISFVQELSLGFGGEQVATLAAGLPWWQLLLAPAAGGLLIGVFVYFVMPGRRPQGVADVIEANALQGGRMSLTTGIKAAVVSAASIGVGASVGREGPVVHLGASLGAWAAKRLHLGRTLARTLLGCGVAAAVAASFNAPIAGTFFALEVVIGHYALSAFAPIVIASVTGTIISRMHYGDSPAFILPEVWSITSFWEFPAFAFLGVISAVAAIVFMRSVMFTEDVMNRTPVPPWARPALGGLIVGAIAIGFPQVLGVGYEATDAALGGLHPLWLLIALFFLKMAAAAISLGCGFGGGVFSPSLFLGAMLGGAYGVIATSAYPELSSGHGAYTIIGMGAVAGAVLGAPISTILMIFELTNDYALTIAVMIATAIASVITQQTHGRSFFTGQLERRGVAIKGGQEIGLLRSIKARDVMDDTFETVTPETPIATVRQRLQHAPWGELFVTGEDGRLTGTITFSDMSDAAFDTSRDAELTAKDVARANPAVLQAEDDLEAAVKIYGASGEVHVPVVENAKTMRLLGVAHEHEVMLAYHRALNQARAEERGEV
jgi:CIC family chloride channel protein